MSAAVHALLEQYPRLRLGGHNLCFDLGFIRAQLPELWAAIKEHGLHKHDRQVDTLHLAEATIEAGYVRSGASLEALCEWYGIAHGGHDALGDARATSQVYDQIMRDLQGAGFITVQAEVTGTAQVFSLKLPLVPRRTETLELGYKTYRVLSDPIYVMSESGYFEYVKIQLHFWDKTVRQP